MIADPREAWLTDLFHAHSGAVLSYARRRVDSEDAQDVVVEVFATAWRRREVVPEAPLPWLYTTAANVISHVIRSEGRRTRLGARLASVTPIHDGSHEPVSGALDALDDRAVIRSALDELAEADAELLRLWAWEQLGPAEIAQVLGCSPGTARTRLHRARTRLRSALVRRGVTGPAVTESATGPDLEEPGSESSEATR